MLPSILITAVSLCNEWWLTKRIMTDHGTKNERPLSNPL